MSTFWNDFMVHSDELYHHGVLGQKWGVRRYQNADGTLTAKGRKHLQKQDEKWIKKNSTKVTAITKKSVSKELNAYARAIASTEGAYNSNGRLSSRAINLYNRKMAQIMSEKVSNLRSPSGKVVSFVAKRGEIGVYMALADEGYNMNQLKNGVWGTGRVAYKKTVLDKA